MAKLHEIESKEDMIIENQSELKELLHKVLSNRERELNQGTAIVGPERVADEVMKKLQPHFDKALVPGSRLARKRQRLNNSSSSSHCLSSSSSSSDHGDYNTSSDEYSGGADTNDSNDDQESSQAHLQFSDLISLIFLTTCLSCTSGQVMVQNKDCSENYQATFRFHQNLAFLKR